MSDALAKRISKLSIILLLMIGVFVFGFQSAYKKVWSYEPVMSARYVAKSLKTYGRVVPQNLYKRAPADAPRERFTVQRPDLVTPGWYVFLLWDDELGDYAAWLYDGNGERHHVWPVHYAAIDPDGPLNENDTPHGFYTMPDGSLLLNFDHADRLARLDACGEAMWTREGVFHHSIDVDPAGGFWTWRGRGTPYAHHHYLTNFDPDTGETLREISLVDDVIRGDETAEWVFGVRADYDFRHFDRTPANKTAVDLFHPNDIEVLHGDMAGAFPGFAAGDLLLSFRNNDLVAVLDPGTARLKWWRHGPWTKQHDPDFRPDGRISVYDNNTGRGRSEIILIDPASGELDSPLHGGEARFYSDSMGTHQYLPGGDVVVVVPDEGRILVLTPDGDKIMEFNNVLPDLQGVNGKVINSQWLPPDHFARTPGCDG